MKVRTGKTMARRKTGSVKAQDQRKRRRQARTSAAAPSAAPEWLLCTSAAMNPTAPTAAIRSRAPVASGSKDTWQAPATHVCSKCSLRFPNF